MVINSQLENKKLIIVPEGELSYATAEELAEFYNNNKAGVAQIVIDLKKLAYISSAGLRVILNIEREMNKLGGLVLKNPNEVIMQAFSVSGFDRFLHFE